LRTAGPVLLGVFGFPVAHSLSPEMQNAAIRRLGLRCIYLKFAVPPSMLSRALDRAESLGFRGVNLTVPHKEAALPLMDLLTPAARRVGAVNTVTFMGAGRREGHTTDGEGFLRATREDLGFTPRGRKVVVLGAGGAARSVCFALADAGARNIVLVNRTPARAARLARALVAEARIPSSAFRLSGRTPWKRLLEGAALLVNATVLGLHGEDSPVPARFLLRPMAVSDLVYNPPVTGLVVAARSRGLRAANGTGMLAGQGALSLERWTGRRAPLAEMRCALLAALARRDGGQRDPSGTDRTLPGSRPTGL